MKLITEEIKKKTPLLYGQDGKGYDAIAYAKFFNPVGSWTWYMTEYDPGTGEAFGLVVGHEKELGYFLVPELQEYKGPLGLGIERDRQFMPISLKEIREI